MNYLELVKETKSFYRAYEVTGDETLLVMAHECDCLADQAYVGGE